jgi:protein gp37
MSDQSSIQWTDATWNPVRGCTKISPGCAHCYAETFAERFRGVNGHPYERGFDLRLVPEKLHEPLRWRKPRRIFVNSMSDLFHKDVPDEFIDRVFAVMALCEQHTFQVLTKRADRLAGYLNAAGLEDRVYAAMESVAEAHEIADFLFDAWPLPNVWLGVSVEDQHRADERIPLLLQTPAAVRFLSVEPLLGPVDLRPWIDCTCNDVTGTCASCLDGGIHWVIVGGESGPGARPMQVEWARSIVKQCKAAGVSVFVKQLGANVNITEATAPVGPRAHRVVKGRVSLVDRKGGDPAEWPEDLRVRDFPS